MQYEVVLLEDEQWVVLRDGIEEARYGEAAQALAHAQRALTEGGEDEWSFGLDFEWSSTSDVERNREPSTG